MALKCVAKNVAANLLQNVNVVQTVIIVIAIVLTQSKNMKINEVIVKEELSFKGYACTKDCSGHQAGYEWARANNVTDTSGCPIDAPNSFTEGCYSFAQGR
jgi:hypothetical protein|tara:strand:+ start:4169 stop:4471 length:303 start_codon:yes stop_codon:yes gene_type:complete